MNVFDRLASSSNSDALGSSTVDSSDHQILVLDHPIDYDNVRPAATANGDGDDDNNMASETVEIGQALDDLTLSFHADDVDDDDAVLIVSGMEDSPTASDGDDKLLSTSVQLKKLSAELEACRVLQDTKDDGAASDPLANPEEINNGAAPTLVVEDVGNTTAESPVAPEESKSDHVSATMASDEQAAVDDDKISAPALQANQDRALVQAPAAKNNKNTIVDGDAALETRINLPASQPNNNTTHTEAPQSARPAAAAAAGETGEIPNMCFVDPMDFAGNNNTPRIAARPTVRKASNCRTVVRMMILGGITAAHFKTALVLKSWVDSRVEDMVVAITGENLTALKKSVVVDMAGNCTFADESNPIPFAELLAAAVEIPAEETELLVEKDIPLIFDDGFLVEEVEPLVTTEEEPDAEMTESASPMVESSEDVGTSNFASWGNGIYAAILMALFGAVSSAQTSRARTSETTTVKVEGRSNKNLRIFDNLIHFQKTFKPLGTGRNTKSLKKCHFPVAFNKLTMEELKFIATGLDASMTVTKDIDKWPKSQRVAAVHRLYQKTLVQLTKAQLVTLLETKKVEVKPLALKPELVDAALEAGF